MPTLDATVYPDEAYVLVQTDWSGALLRDSFQRVSASGWQLPDVGPIWNILSGAGADITVNGFQGVMNHAAVNTSRLVTSNINAANVDFSGSITSASVPAGGNFEARLLLRFVDLSNFIDARIFFTSAGTISVNIRQFVAGVETLLTGFPVIAGLPVSGTFRFRFYANGPELRIKVWLAGTPEPLAWSASTTAATHLTAGGTGVGTFVANTVTTPVPIVFLWDNLVAIDLTAAVSDCAYVTRRNTVTGEVVRLRPYIAYDEDGSLLLDCGEGLWWDTESPLDVPLEYCVFSCPAQVNLVANSNFETGTVPWVATGGVLTQSATFAHEGLFSGLLTPTGTARNPQIAQTFAGVTNTSELTFSGWVMTPQGWNGVLIRMSLLYSDGRTEVFETPVEILDDNEWRFLSLTVTPRLPATATFSVIVAGQPPNTTLFYMDQLQAVQQGTSVAGPCETVTVPGNGNFWLKNPLSPCLDIRVGICNPMLYDCEEDSRVSFQSMVEDTYSPNTTLSYPVNREHPISQYRIRRGPEATLRLIAHDCDARDAVLAINKPGNDLLWQSPAEYCTPDRYMSVGVVTETKISVDHREPFRLMALPHVAVDRPNGPANGVCGARIIDLCDLYASWTSLSLSGLTWTDLLLGEASPSGPGQPPVADARTWDDVEAEFADWTAVTGGATRDWDELRDGL